MRLKTHDRRQDPNRKRTDRRRAERYQDRKTWCTLAGTGLDIRLQVVDTSAVGYRLSCIPSSTHYPRAREILAESAKHTNTTCLAQVRMPGKAMTTEKVRIVNLTEITKEIIISVERGVA